MHIKEGSDEDRNKSEREKKKEWKRERDENMRVVNQKYISQRKVKGKTSMHENRCYATHKNAKQMPK